MSTRSLATCNCNALAPVTCLTKRIGIAAPLGLIAAVTLVSYF